MLAEKEIRIFIHSVRYEVEASLFTDADDDIIEMPADGETEPEKMQIKTVGKYTVDGDRLRISYQESEVTGMEGSETEISFDMRDTGVVTMSRTGVVSTALIFESGKRHHCVYQTPYMPFEVCVKTLNVKNNIGDNGCLELDYIVEIRGAKAERTTFSMRIMD
jgi:uncharacterized beta-barrel protein YwiB (DUF1934 family)